MVSKLSNTFAISANNATNQEHEVIMFLFLTFRNIVSIV